MTVYIGGTGFTFDIEFDQRTLNSLKSLLSEQGESAVLRILRDALRRAGRVALSAIKGFVPVLRVPRAHRIAGALKRALKVSARISRGRALASIPFPPRSQISVAPEESGYYPLHLEFMEGGKYSYFRRGFDSVESSLEAELVAEIYRGIAKFWRDGRV